MDRAQSDATSRQAMGAVAQVEAAAAASCAGLGDSSTASAAIGQSSREGDAASPAGTIDTVALQQEVSQLRQQVYHGLS